MGQAGTGGRTDRQWDRLPRGLQGCSAERGRRAGRTPGLRGRGGYRGLVLVVGTGGAEPSLTPNPKISRLSSAPPDPPPAGGGELYQERGSSINVSMATFLPPPLLWSIQMVNKYALINFTLRCRREGGQGRFGSPAGASRAPALQRWV